LAIFDSVDDTKFVSKLVLDELFRSIDDLFANDYGRKVLTYLIAPRDSRFFIKTYVSKLEYGDQSETSKKSPEIRRNELCSYSIKFVYEYVSKNLESLLKNGAAGILIPEIIQKLDQKLLDEILNKLIEILLTHAYEKNKEHLIENATTHYIIKHIITNDKSSSKNNLFLCNYFCFKLNKFSIKK
jgi:pumilio family protein 6